MRFARVGSLDGGLGFKDAGFASTAYGDYVRGAGGGEEVQPLLMPDVVDSREGEAMVGGAPTINSRMQSDAAQRALGMMGDVGSSRLRAEYAKRASQAEASGRKAGSIFSALGTIAGAGIMALCDVRSKVDIELLTTAPANDLLAQLAYRVKGLREHP